MHNIHILFHKPEVFLTKQQWKTVFPEFQIEPSYSLEDTRDLFKKRFFDIAVCQEKDSHPLLLETLFNGRTKVMIYSQKKKQSNSLIYLQYPFNPDVFFLKIQELYAITHRHQSTLKKDQKN